MILAFEDEKVLGEVYSFVVFYIDLSVANETERVRCRTAFKQIMSQFFGIKNFTTHSLSSTFDE
jgi:hypothetical protein